MKDILFIFIGGGVGSVLRYLTSLGWKFWQSGHGVACSFPWPTLIVNVVGCFLIGLFYKYSGQWGWSDDTRLLMTTVALLPSVLSDTKVSLCSAAECMDRLPFTSA